MESGSDILKDMGLTDPVDQEKVLAFIQLVDPDVTLTEAVMMVCKKARNAAHHGNKDFVYELARTAISHLAGTGAVHDVPSWKTPEKYDWAAQELAKALEE